MQQCNYSGKSGHIFKRYIVKLLLILFISGGTFTPAVFSQITEEPPPVAQVKPVVVPENHSRKFEEGFQEKYNDDDFNYKPPSVVKSRWQRFKEWFWNWIAELFRSDNPEKTSKIVNTVLTAIAIVVILFVVYIIVAAILNKEGLWIFGRSRKKIASGVTDVEDINQMDFKTLIEGTKKDDNYRLAVRYYYLWLLKKLSVKNIIDWNWEKTNSDYLYEIKDSNLKKDFEYLSYVYDYSWYGEFTLSDESFNKAEKAFLKTFNNI